jgi:hypothetical protein
LKMETPPPSPPRNGEGSLISEVKKKLNLRSQENQAPPSLSGKGAGGLGHTLRKKHTRSSKFQTARMRQERMQPPPPRARINKQDSSVHTIHLTFSSSKPCPLTSGFRPLISDFRPLASDS